jgi:hypothetical protein
MNALLLSMVLLAADDDNYVAQVLLQVEMTVDPSAKKDALRFVDAGYTEVTPGVLYRGPARPSPAWVQFEGAHRWLVDAQGYVHLPSRPKMIKDVRVYLQREDKTPLTTIPEVDVVERGKMPRPSVARVATHFPPGEMNAAPQ